MKSITQYTAIALFILLPVFFCGGTAAAQENSVKFLDKNLIKQLNHGIYEVVTPKLESSKIEYDRPLPFDKLDFKERNEKYHSIGTAFFISGKELMTAGHVFSPMYFSLHRKFFIRDSEGTVYPVGRIHKYSTVRDLLVFDLEQYPEQITQLKFCRQLQVEVGDTVFSVGNALGEGVAYRAGQVASFTDEREYGLWKDIRFSSPTSPGNSGGPLLNLAGEVVGVIVKAPRSENYNIAVPISELDHLTDKAEFYLRNVRADIDGTDERILRDWSFSLPLPAPVAEVAEKAQASLDAFYRKLDVELTEKVKDKNFPKGERFRYYLRTQEHGFKGAVSLFPDNNFSTWRAVDYVMDKLPLSAEQNVYCKGEFPDDYGGPFAHLRVIVEKPKTGLKEFLDAPKTILDTLLKAAPFYRYLGAERIRITSFGEPEQKTVWQDRLGRTVTSSLWYGDYDNYFICTHCLPYPKGALCVVEVKPANMLKLDYLERTKENCDEIAVGYEGELDDWAEYLALGDNYLPAFFHKAEIARDGSRLKVRLKDFQFDFNNPKIDGTSDLHLHMGYASDQLLAEELIRFELFPQKGSPAHYSIQPFFEPSPFGAESYAAAWKEGSASAGEFSGKAVSKGDLRVVQKTVPQTKKTVNAFDGQKIEKIFVVGCAYKAAEEENIEQDCGRFFQSVSFF